MHNDYEEDEVYSNIYTSSVVTSLPTIGSKKSTIKSTTTATTTTTLANGTNISLKPEQITVLPESSNPTPEEGKSKVSSPIHHSISTNIINSTISSNNKNNDTSESDDSFDALLGFLSGDSSNTTTTFNLDDHSTNVIEIKDEININNNNINIDSNSNNNEMINDKGDINIFKDEILWNRNDEDNKDIDEFLKSRILESFKNNTIKPREHQMKTIQSVLKDIIKPKYNKSFKSENRYNYLIQHAAGSGKSLTIAMLVYFLYKIEVNNRLKFDTIVVMNDRTQLDAQLGDIIIKFLKSNGITNYCRPKSSKELQKEITMGKNRIIITTMQKFAQLLPAAQKNNNNSNGNNNGNGSNSRACTIEDDFAFKYNNVAIISDEAHRSHGKSTTEKLHNFLNGNTRQPGLITYFSFTCTPTIQCLEMFGIASNGNRVPFNTYSMAEAQKDKLVLDVMSSIKFPFSESGYGVGNGRVDEFNVYNYMNDDEFYYYEDERDVKRGRSKLDEDISDMKTISEKSKFIVKHIIDNKKIFDKGNFKSRAMLVCNGRRNLLLFKKTIDDYIQSLPVYERFDTIAAFSPFLVDGKNILESDPSVNGKYAQYGSDKMRGITKALLEDKNYRIRLILVADKLQTGFDEPSLCLMYIDKKIKGANAVQTLSRLSRIAKDKTSTLIIDFVNDEREIKQVFKLYGNSTTLRDLQDTSTLSSALQVASQEIQNTYCNERNINSFCKAIIYHQENITEQAKKYKALEYSIETFLEVYRVLSSRNETIPVLTIQPKTVETIKSTLYSLRQEKKKEMALVDDSVKVKIDYLTDEESKNSEVFNTLNVDYDAEFAAKLWSEASSKYSKDPIYEMTKKLDDFQNTTIKSSNHINNNNNNSFKSNFINNNNNNNKYDLDADSFLDYKNKNYQTNFSKPIPNLNDLLKNKSSGGGNSSTSTPLKPAPFVKKDLWSTAGSKTLGKRPTNSYPKPSANLVQPNKKFQLERSNNND